MKTKKSLLFLIFLGVLCTAAVSNTKQTNTHAKPTDKILEKISNSFASIGKKAIPATVFIKTEYVSKGRSGLYAQNPLHDEFFKKFFGQGPSMPDNKPAVGAGSGVIVQEDGTILTNNHVIENASKITVVLHDGREYDATVLGTDPETDLAILKISESKLPFLNLGDSEALKIGNLVFAIGSPCALESSLTHGIVSALKRIDLGITCHDNFIQTDAAINPGNSGGPLLNIYGEVIGINTAKMGGGYHGIGFAIPSNIASHILEQILSNGSVKRAYLGIVLQPIDKGLSEALALKNQEGILVADVAEDSPAQKAGIKQGDIIIKVNKEKIKSAGQFRTQVALKEPGTQIKLTVLRNNKTVDIPVTLGQTEDKPQKILEKLGLEVDNLNPNLSRKLGLSPNTEGVAITRVTDSSPAQKAGLQPYFLITGVMQGWGKVDPVANTKDLNDALKVHQDRKHVVLVIRHRNFQRYYTLKVE